MAIKKTTGAEAIAVYEEAPIMAEELDVTLALSDEALKEIEEIEERAIEASQHGKKVFWR